MSFLSAVDFTKGGGTITAVAQDASSGEILMVAHMDERALRRTLEAGEVVYWSRSRGELWRKGEQSGNVQRLVSVHLDCDGDTVLLRVDQVGGAACHTGKRSCFFRRLRGAQWVDEGEQVFDPAVVYGQ